MNNFVENTEIEKFYRSLVQDLLSTQITNEDGGTIEQLFTQYATDLLAEAGETENVRIAYDEGQLGTKNQHKINAYGEPDNYETIDLFIIIYKADEEPVRVGKDEIETAVKRVTNFYRKAKNKNYLNDIEETSEIWDFVRTLSHSKALEENLVRVNAIVLTNGLYPNEFSKNETVTGQPFFYRVVDLNYLYNISEKAHVPIEIDFCKDGFQIPCIASPSKNSQYQSYLAIFPAIALVSMYEKYGSRLLEQNVRSFLQFTGKVNKGIRKTILDEPHMFLAFNNGIAATAESIKIEKAENGGHVISKIEDFQIVNGGQTTASIYHTAKKDKAKIDEIFVQVKLSVIKNKKKFSEIVSSIAEYANTQNKVAFSELSSNIPFHIDLEKLSRNIFAPYVSAQANQTMWFYERARGQYKNARLRDGFTKARQKVFDIRHPRNQVFTKGDLAKFINAFSEVRSGKKIVVGPHVVVRGTEKNYVEFVKHNLPEKVDNIFFENVIAQAILFKTAEKIYGVKPNAIGDLRYITVPYAISFISFKTENKIDLYKIWKNQDLSANFKTVLKSLMVRVEKYIKTLAPGALYGEFAKKEECWNLVKEQNFNADLRHLLKQDLENLKDSSIRKRLNEEDVNKVQEQDELSRLLAVPQRIWEKIADWGRETEILSSQEITTALYMYAILKNPKDVNSKIRETGNVILNKVSNHAPDLLAEVEKIESLEDLLKTNCRIC